MSERGVHYLAQASIRAKLAKNAEEIERASLQLQEALKLGDLRENSEYDAAKDAMAKLTKERDMLSPVLSMPVVRSNDTIGIFEEGSVVALKVYGTLQEPLDPRGPDYQALIKDTQPLFVGKVMLGGTLPIQELLIDAALDTDTPVGAYLLGKQSGQYIVKVPGGFVPVIAKKLKTGEFVVDDIGCTFYDKQ